MGQALEKAFMMKLGGMPSEVRLFKELSTLIVFSIYPFKQ